MKSKNKIFLVLILFVLFQSCDSRTTEETLVKNYDSLTTVVDTLHENDGEEDGLPPFKVNCNCKYEYFGFYKISNSNYNLYVSGKGWNPKLASCQFEWGELIGYEIPEDTNVTVFHIHLLDLEKFTIPTNGTVYGDNSIKRFVMAVYTINLTSGKDTCVFAPYKPENISL